MIPALNITAWSREAPWAEQRQIEQNLIISRAIVEIFRDPFLAQELRFRGGTALNKLHFPKPLRYSEDIDLVRTTAGPIGAVLDQLRAVLEPWLGRAVFVESDVAPKLRFRVAAACFAELPAEARVLVVCCGTVCRRRLVALGLSDRVQVHLGTMADLRIEPCHGATAILVSQHLVEEAMAIGFFSSIAANLVRRGLLYSADIALPPDEASRDTVLRVWEKQGIAEGVPSESLASLRERLRQKIAPRSPDRIRDLLRGVGFESSLELFQSLLYRACISEKRG